MKNEVKKKMMIELRKLSHQSHEERVFGSKSQEVFRRLHRAALNFPSGITSPLALNSPATRQIAWHRFNAVVGSAHLAAAHSSVAASIMKVTKSSWELDSWPLLTMLSSSPAAAPPSENFKAASPISAPRNWAPSRFARQSSVPASNPLRLTSASWATSCPLDSVRIPRAKPPSSADSRPRQVP